MASVEHENVVHSVERHLLGPFIRNVIEGTEKLMEFGDDNVEKLGEGEYIKMMNILRDIRRHVSSVPVTDLTRTQSRVNMGEVEQVIQDANNLLSQLPNQEQVERPTLSTFLSVLKALERGRTPINILEIQPIIQFSINIHKFGSPDFEEPISYTIELPSITFHTSRSRITSFKTLAKALINGMIWNFINHTSFKQLLVSKTINNLRTEQHIINHQNLYNVFHNIDFIKNHLIGEEIYNSMLQYNTEHQNDTHYYKLFQGSVPNRTLFSKSYKFNIDTTNANINEMNYRFKFRFVIDKQ